MSLPNQDGLGGGSMCDDIEVERPDSPFSMSDHNRPYATQFGGCRQFSVDTIVSTPPSLSLPHQLAAAYPTEDHQTFRYLQQLKANCGGGECHKDGSLFSIHSAPPVPLADNSASCMSSPVRTNLQSRPVSLALDPNAMLTVQFAGVPPSLSMPVAAAHSSSAIEMPAQSDEADEEENENLWTLSSQTARPLIVKSKEWRNNVRFMSKPGARTDTSKSSSASSGKSSTEITMDGGYGWLVVLGAFSVQFWVAGLVKSYGVLYVEILETFPNVSSAVASWIPAILSALCLVLAPVSSALSQRFSCRLVVFIGGLFCALGLTLSYFATNLIHLFFTFGVLTGLGGGLSTTPGIIIVSQYFDKRRALANGICVSGTAAGSFVFPMLIDHLVRGFGFHGTILILGGCMLHVCASAALYKPVPDSDSVPDEVDNTSNRSCHLKSADTTQTLVSQNSYSVLGTYLSASAEEPLNTLDGKKIFIENLFLEEAKNRLNELCQSNKLGPDSIKQDVSDDEGKDFMGETIVMKPFAKCMRSSSVYLHSVEDLSTDSTFVYKKRGSGHESNRGSSRKRSKPGVATVGGVVVAPTEDPGKCNDAAKKNSIPSTGVPDEEGMDAKMCQPVDNENQIGQTPAPINRGLSKSMMIIPTSQLITEEDETCSYRKTTQTGEDEEEEDVDDGKSSMGCVNWINNYLDLSLLSDPMFILMCLSVVFMSTGSPYMLYYLPAYVLSAGYTKSDAGYLVAISAAFDLTGRLGFGYLSDLQLFDRRKAFIVCIFGAGLAVLLLSVAQSSFYCLAASVGIYGFCVGSWYLLTPVLLADVFGTERISSSYGLIRMFQGVGAITVPPLTGFLRDLTGAYDICFYAMGTCMMIGCLPMLISLVLTRDEEDGADSEGDCNSNRKESEGSP